MIRTSILALAALCACHVAAREHEEGAAQRRARWQTSGPCGRNFDLDRCQEEMQTEAFCFTDPDGPRCAELRAQGRIPAAPPSPEELAGCYSAGGRGEAIGRVVICVARTRLSIRAPSGGWDQIAVKEWHRDDTAENAVWAIATADGAGWQLIWLGADHVHVLDEAGQWNTDVRRVLDATVTAELAALPDVATVCRRARACSDAATLARQPPSSGDLAESSTPEISAVSLAACHHAMQQQVDQLVLWGIPVPSVCDRIPPNGPAIGPGAFPRG